MSSIAINLDPVAMREATTQAIMGILTPEVRERILREAISHLLNPSTSSWERGKSPIQTAFDRAVEQVAGEIAREHVKSDPKVMEQLRDLVKRVSDKVMSADADKMAERMADAFVSSMQRG